VWGGANVPAQLPQPASRLYAQNVVNLVTLMTRDGAFDPDPADEIVAGSCVTRDGAILHEPTRLTVEGPLPDHAAVGAHAAPTAPTAPSAETAPTAPTEGGRP
jgi:NAD(P) transhydrogenase subunit alpha